jgi:hypothetical protein
MTQIQIKKFVAILLCIVTIIVSCPLVNAASIPSKYIPYIVNGRVDYKELHQQYFKIQDSSLESSSSSFIVTVNGTAQGFSDSGNVLNAKMGDALTIQNTSEIGSGNSLIKCDFQISNGTSIIYSTTSLGSISLNSIPTNKEGIYNIYLNVMDNEDMIKTEGWGNWAYNGTHKSAGTNPGGGTGSDFPGWWYYSKLTVKIEKNMPTPDFTINYKGENVTDNKASPETVDPGDKSLVLEDCSTPFSAAEPITALKWSYWDVNNGWKEIAGSANKTTVNINDMDAGLPGSGQNKAFKLECTSSTAAMTSKEHTSYFSKVLASGYIIYYRDQATDRDIYPAKERPGLGFGTYIEYALPTPANSVLITPSPKTIILDASTPTVIFTFYYRMDNPPPPPPPPLITPPTALLTSPTTVMAGALVTANGSQSRSNNVGGYIADYYFDYEGANLIRDNGSNVKIWYPTMGIYTIYLQVEDEKGSTDWIDRDITVTPPIPTAVIGTTGRLKENRKITIDSSQSTSPAYYPIDMAKTTWIITPVSGGTAADIKYSGVLNGLATKDILFKKAGQYKVKLTVTNTYGKTASTETTLTIAPDLPPIADLFLPTPAGVEYAIYRLPTDSNYATFEVFNESVSPDGDIINKAVAMYCYDSDNDGNYQEETWYYSKDGTTWQPTGMTYTNMVSNFNIYSIATANIAKFTLKTKEVGDCYFVLRVMETIPTNETIPEFIGESDYKRADTFN